MLEHRGLDPAVVRRERAAAPVRAVALLRAPTRTATPASPRAARASASSQPSPQRGGQRRQRVHRDLADRVLRELADRHRAADVVDVVGVPVVGRLDRHDRAQVRRPRRRDLDRGEAAVRQAPHPDRAGAPRLRGQPLDGVVAVERLGLGVLVQGDAVRSCRSRGRRAGSRRSRARRGRRRATGPSPADQSSLRYGSMFRITGTRRRAPTRQEEVDRERRRRRAPGRGRLAGPRARARPGRLGAVARASIVGTVGRG